MSVHAFTTSVGESTSRMSGIGEGRIVPECRRLTALAQFSEGDSKAIANRLRAQWDSGKSLMRARSMMALSNMRVPRRLHQPHSAVKMFQAPCGQSPTPKRDLAHPDCILFNLNSARGAVMQNSMPYRAAVSLHYIHITLQYIILRCRIV